MSFHEKLLQLAINEALRGKSSGELPFGAVLVDPDFRPVLSMHDTVAQDGDYTSHAETLLIRQGCRRFGPNLHGFSVYTTTEPCPMCFTTCWLARVSRIVYGSTMEEVRIRSRGAVEELMVPASEMNNRGGRRVELIGGVLREACLAMFDAQDAAVIGEIRV